MITLVRTKIFALLLGLLTGVGYLLLPGISFAADPDPAVGLGSYVELILFKLVNGVFGTLAGVAGKMLNLSINNFIIGFGEIYTVDGLGFAIDSMWVLMRDIFNLTFIFGLVFIGLKMIFNSSDSSTKKLLVSLILAALFVNFSLFITKFVIDFSNIASTQFVNAFPQDKVDPTKRDFSSAFANTMGLPSVHKMEAADFEKNFSGAGGLGFIFGQLFVYIVVIFVFMGGALLIMIRFAVLSIYMLLSPLMFIGWVFPSAAGISKEYWKGFLGRCFFAPAYILMLYFSLKILTSYKLLKPPAENATLANAFSSGVGIETSLPPFILTAVFLIMSLVIAQKMGAHGASGVISFGKTLTGTAKRYAGNSTFGLAAAAGRNTVGYGANKLSTSLVKNNWAGRFGGQTVIRASRAVADSSLDARNIGGVGTKMGIGAGAKGGYVSREKELKKRDEDFAKSLDKVEIKNANGDYLNATDKDGKPILDKDNKPVSIIQANLDKLQTESVPLSKKRTEKAVAEESLKTTSEALEIARKAVANAPKTLPEAQRKNLETRLEAAKSAFDTAKQLNDSVTKQEDDIIKGLKKEAEASVIYSRQLAFIKRREQELAFKRKPIVAIGSVLAPYASGAALGATVGLAPGVAAAGMMVTVAGGNAEKDKGSISNLRKIYGETGINAVKKEKEKASVKKLLDEIDAEKPAEDKDKD